jgi:hypothetical protein
MSAPLASAGFTSIRRCEMEDSGDPAFAAVEQPDRFFDEPTGIREPALDCQRPAGRWELMLEHCSPPASGKTRLAFPVQPGRSKLEWRRA